MPAAESQDPEIEVRNLDDPKKFTTWRISRNLTDRWGEINDCDAEHEPLETLRRTPGLLARLRAQMIAGSTSVVRKDGKFGILFMDEYASQDSQKNCGAGDWKTYPRHEKLLRSLIVMVEGLKMEFPMVEWAIPSEKETFAGCLAIWGYFPDGALTKEQREAVRHAFYRPVIETE